MIIGTAGHVDHGKTALVKALTGIDADRLAEEKRRGITIDLGYAYTDTLGFVDVPGHERFVHTMLAGAAGIDAALLVVALPEGVMPQTREHLQILRLLGIDRGVVALSKADLAPDRIATVTAQMRSLLAGTGLAEAPILPVSALTGAGIDDLGATLAALTPRTRPLAALPRLAVDRAFTLAGTGLVVTGTLVSGRIAVEDRLVLTPAGLELRVRGLHAQNRPAAQAVAGQRVALNITGPRLAKDMVTRGDWVVHPALHAPTDRVDVQLTVLPDAPPLRNDSRLHLHLGAAHAMARVALLDTAAAGEPAFARLALDKPIGALATDRIVLRDVAATRTVGGGVVLDPFPPRRGRQTALRQRQLHALTEPAAAAALRALLAEPPNWTDAASFFLARNVPAAEAAAVVSAAGAVRIGGLLLSPATRSAFAAAMLDTLAQHHTAAPEQPGLHAEHLRLRLLVRLPADGFRDLVDTLLRSGVLAQDGPWLRLPQHQITLSAADETLWAQARPLLATDRFRPPRTRDLAHALAVAETAMRATLKRLQRLGEVIEIAPDHFFLRATVAEMAGIAASLSQQPAGLTAATFRDRLDNGRKVAIQVLEYFDRSGLTIRQEERRRVRLDRLDLFGTTAVAMAVPAAIDSRN
jgi:selenocysteine-specific elongation factor